LGEAYSLLLGPTHVDSTMSTGSFKAANCETSSTDKDRL